MTGAGNDGVDLEGRRGRVAEILIGTARPGSTVQQVWPHRERDSRRRSDRHGGVQRIAGLNLGNQSHLPAGNQPVARERQLVEPTQYKPVPRVVFRWSIIAARIVDVLN